MRTLQSAKRAILFLLLVLAFTISSTTSALDISGDSVSGEATEEPLTLEEDSAVLPSSPDPETATILPPIAIRAINPGYNLPAGKNSGELIELINLTDDELDLSGLSIIYISKPTASSPAGKATKLYTFPTGATFIGDSILFRYADSPEAVVGAQDLTYDAASLAMSGTLVLIFPSDSDASSIASIDTMTADELLASGIVINSVCWLGGESCLPIFSTTVKSRQYTTIMLDLEIGEYFHTNEYAPLYNPEQSGLYIPPPTSLDDELDTDSDTNPDSDPDSIPSTHSSSDTTTTSSKPPVCSGLEFSEILSYYAEDKDEQFIEFYNSSATSIPLNECRLQYKNKTYALATTPLLLAPDSYYVFYPSITLTKNPTTSNLYEILDTNNDVVDSLDFPHGQKKSTSFALMGKNFDGSNLWQITYSPSPGRPNVYQEYRTCPVGKIINTSTGNCVNVATLETVLKDCGAGKYRNPATGRCKSYDSDDGSEPTPCQEGYERNPETNRCRKIKQNNGTDYPLVPITDTEGNKSFVALGAIVAVLALGILYVLFQFRRDIYYFFRHLITKLKR